MTEAEERKFMQRAIELANIGMDHNAGGPFGAVIVLEGKIVGEGYNNVTSKNDPTAHAEIVAIRNACSKLQRFHLDNCTIFCSCEPCPMCLSAIYWARLSKIYFAANKHDAAHANFDDAFIYQQFELDPQNREIPSTQLLAQEGSILFKKWIEKDDKISY